MYLAQIRQSAKLVSCVSRDTAALTLSKVSIFMFCCAAKLES